MRRIKFIWLLLLIVVLGCKEQRAFNKVLKGHDRDAKFNSAIKYYGEKDYFKAIPLLENLIAVEKGGQRGVDIYYYYAWCQVGVKDYYLATYYFKNFAKTYPSSEKAEECLFMSAYCNYILSPEIELDQAETKEAIRGFQLFLNQFPETKRKDTCNILMDQLANKLENKAYEGAYLYYQTMNYHAASIAFQNILHDYPETDKKENILFLIVKSNYSLAINSVESKKVERFEETIKSYYTFASTFSESNKIKEANNIKADAERNLALLSSKKTN